MSLRLGFVPALVVSSAKMAEEVMRTHDLEFSGRPSLLGQQKMSYNGLDLIFTPHGDYWREMRKISALQLFNLKRVQSFHSIRENEVSCMIQRISKDADASKSTNLRKAAMALTSSIICRVAFGKTCEVQGGEISKFHILLHEAQAIMGSFSVSDYIPFMGWIDKLTGLVARLEKNFSEFDAFYQEIIDEHLDPDRTKPEQEDIIDVLLRLKKERSFAIDLTWDHIKAMLMNIFIGGTNTSAGTLEWAMTALMKAPRVMNKVQREVRSLLGDRRLVKEDDLVRLPYLKAVVKETWRLYPVAPLLVPRETTQNCSIDGYDIPARTLVFVNAWAIGRDPEAWEAPEEFYPERFFSKSVDFKGQDYELIPFGAGRRGCPGIHMGAVTVELALANLLCSFDWEMPPGLKAEDIDIDVLPGITMHKKNALCLMPRNNCHMSSV
ncbi:CYTOCHROME P450 71B11-RELATED [Salix koriyanagi]|uniref:CYTOCHROME P450 71B11-RELATED n=1 Tax=Salix koriyanagi TaxID=2511006 RepID=A0A9Q0P3W3_9ROSI|nr:CYTOCHROME P450 71B11-RELATED [Salix koriyanagi]